MGEMTIALHIAEREHMHEGVVQRFRAGVLSRVAMVGTLSKSKRKWVAFLAAGLLLFTQFATASQACRLAVHGAAQQPMAMEGCDSMAMQKAVCQAHCATLDQAGLSLDQHFVFISTVAAIPVADFPSHAMGAPFRQTLLPVAGPPLRILHCSYQF